MSTLLLSVIIGVLALVGVVVTYMMRKRRAWTFCMSVFIVCVIFAVLSLIFG